MTTLIAYSGSSGNRRCDANCHNARHPRCTCICGGALHGKGQEAQQILTDACAPIVERLEEEGGAVRLHKSVAVVPAGG